MYEIACTVFEKKREKQSSKIKTKTRSPKNQIFTINFFDKINYSLKRTQIFISAAEIEQQQQKLSSRICESKVVRGKKLIPDYKSLALAKEKIEKKIEISRS